MEVKVRVLLSIMVMLILISINISSENLSTPDIQDYNRYNSLETLPTQQKIQPQQPPATNQPSSRANNARDISVESDVHGGNWFDSFDDETGINWTMSDNLYLNKSIVKLKKLILSKPFQNDSSTVALWHFDEGSGTVVHDETDNYNNGTLGGDGVGTDLPTWTTGSFDSALAFDGVDDYIAVSDNSTLQLREAFTLHAWVKPISSTGGAW